VVRTKPLSSAEQNQLKNFQATFTGWSFNVHALPEKR
jgi:hypothetical protein